MYRPRRIIINPPKLCSGNFSINTYLPISDAPRPREINIEEKPTRKNREFIKTFFRKSKPALSKSAKDTPLIKERKLGIRGRTQGEKKYKNPAIKATLLDNSLLIGKLF